MYQIIRLTTISRIWAPIWKSVTLEKTYLRTHCTLWKNSTKNTPMSSDTFWTKKISRAQSCENHSNSTLKPFCTPKTSIFCETGLWALPFWEIKFSTRSSSNNRSDYKSTNWRLSRKISPVSKSIKSKEKANSRPFSKTTTQNKSKKRSMLR